MAQESPWLIIGLGNPGSRYDNTRHNVGRDVVELLAARTRTNLKRHRSGTLCGNTRLGGGPPLPGMLDAGTPATLAIARTYMNVSGPPYVSLMKSSKIDIDRVLVIHDDLDLPAHTLRLKKGGGEGGHNGLRSLSGALKSKDYARLRIGIGRPPGNQDAATYVLSPIPKTQREEWRVTIEQAADVVEQIVTDGIPLTQMDLHSRS